MKLLLNWTFSCGLYSIDINDTIFVNSPYALVRSPHCLQPVFRLDLLSSLKSLSDQPRNSHLSTAVRRIFSLRLLFSGEKYFPYMLKVAPPATILCLATISFISFNLPHASPQTLRNERESLLRVGFQRFPAAPWSGHGIIFNQQKH
jgi:hypothetical protein